MRGMALAVAVAMSLFLTAQTGSAQQPAAISRELETCIRTNAANVTRAVPDLSAATDFLVTNVCAAELAAEARVQQQAHAAQMRAVMERQCANLRANRPAAEANAQTDAEIDEVAEYDPCTWLDAYTESMMSYSGLLVTSEFDNPAARGLAARLVLEARLAAR